MDQWKPLARNLTGWELMRRLKAGHDIALLPVGSMEMHGPQLPLGTDTLVADSAEAMAEVRDAWEGVELEASWPSAIGQALCGRQLKRSRERQASGP